MLGQIVPSTDEIYQYNFPKVIIFKHSRKEARSSSSSVIQKRLGQFQITRYVNYYKKIPIFTSTYKNIKPSEPRNRKARKSSRTKSTKNKRNRKSRNRKTRRTKKKKNRNRKTRNREKIIANLTNNLSIILKEMLLPYFLRYTSLLIKTSKRTKSI